MAVRTRSKYGMAGHDCTYYAKRFDSLLKAVATIGVGGILLTVSPALLRSFGTKAKARPERDASVRVFD